ADEEGPALALRDTLSDAVVVPRPVVGQSWNDQATGEWMGGYVDWLGGQLQQMRADAGTLPGA
ncbi:DUF3806 domain-containing protein, partial [Micrococcus sp. SIMBA_144]